MTEMPTTSNEFKYSNDIFWPGRQQSNISTVWPASFTAACNAIKPCGKEPFVVSTPLGLTRQTFINNNSLFVKKARPKQADPIYIASE